MTEFITRSINEYVMPLTEGTRVLHPEKVVLCFGKKRHVDIGRLCYLRRKSGARWGCTPNKGSPVDPDSFDKMRAEHVRILIDYFSEMMAHSGRSLSTLSGKAANFIRFIDWCDTNGHHLVMESEFQAREAFRAYVAYLRERLRKQLTKSMTLRQYQTHALEALSDHLGIDNLHEGINLIRVERDSEPTPPPDEDAVSRVLGLCVMLFDGLTALVLENRPYPYKLLMPKQTGWKDDYLWIFPTNKWFIRPDELDKRHKMKKPYWAYDYANGRLATRDKITEYYSKRSFANNVIRSAEKRIDAANTDPRHHHRLVRAMMAHHAFFLMFLSNTGINLEQARTLPWGDNAEVEAERQGFRTIKCRAHNKKVSFDIQSSFLQHFRRYLDLRNYLLGKQECDLLFISLGANCSSVPNMIDEKLLSSFYDVLRKIDPSLPKIMSRGWRAKKSDWLIGNIDPSIAATLLNNNERTIFTHYAEGSETQATVEIGNFLEQMSEGAARIVLQRGEELPDGWIDSEVGECAKYGDPQPIESETPVKPDCHQPEGCLFCDKFKVHADERDTRKLLSCRYCINQTAHLASQEQFKERFGPILERIDLILAEIEKKADSDAGMVDRITAEVEEEEMLDLYWEGKLQMLIELGLASQ